jgi:hypothetical protein
MARVTIIFEDQPMTGGGHVEVTVSSDPPLPITRITDPQWLAEIDGDQDLDMKQATNAQIAARLAVQEIAGAAGTAAIFARSDD